MTSECLAVRIRAVNRMVTKFYDDALRPLDVKVSQLNMLVVIAKGGEILPSEICGILHMDASTVSRNTNRMHQKGWIDVRPGDDRRQRPLRLTAKGKRLIARAWPAWNKAQSQARGLLGKDGADLLQGSLDPMAGALQQ